jgi:hypothetical protein
MAVTIAHMKVNGADLKAQSALHGLEYQLNGFIPLVVDEQVKAQLLAFRLHIFKEISRLEELNRELMKAPLKKK